MRNFEVSSELKGKTMPIVWLNWCGLVLVGLLVSWLVGWSVGWLVGWLAGWLVGLNNNYNLSVCYFFHFGCRRCIPSSPSDV